MQDSIGRSARPVLAGVLVSFLFIAVAHAQVDPPGRVGRLAFVDGTVSFHDDDQSGWSKAVVNTPLTTGDAIWTEPGARSEISLAGTRIRMESATELDMLQIDDQQVRLQLAQGRIDVKTVSMDTSRPYQIVTPRGIVTLQQQGDYYIEAGTTQDPTRLGVRSGAAQFQSPDGQTLAVRAGEIGEALGDGSTLKLKTVQTAPPPPAAGWTARDRQVIYDQPPQYVPAGMTGYEDLNAYGNWINDGSYGQVWAPRSVPQGWAPYRTGHWSYVQPWGWTWIDDQPWGFAPYHYGRWANSQGRWVWVPPQREQAPVYAPALVAFVGGLELAAQLANQSTAPVGWFPLGPREVYVPSYSTDRDYYRRLNRAARIQDRELEESWERAQRREAFRAGRDSVLMNQRYATVVPTQAFVQSQPVQRAALRVAADQLGRAAVAPVAAPPAPTASIAAVRQAPPGADQKATPPNTGALPGPKQTAPQANDAKRQADAEARAKAAAPNVAVSKTAIADMPTLARPAAGEKTNAPGPAMAPRQARTSGGDKNAAMPPLAPAQGNAPADRSSKEPGEPAKESGKTSSEPAPAPPAPSLPQARQAPDRERQPQDQRQEAPRQAAPSPKPDARPEPREAPRQAAPAQRKPETPSQPQRQESRPQEQQRAPAQAAPREEPARQTQPQRAPVQQEAQPPKAQQPQPSQRQEPQRPEQPRQAQPQRPEPPQQQQAQPPQAQPPRQNNDRPGPPQGQGPQRRDNDDKK